MKVFLIIFISFISSLYANQLNYEVLNTYYVNTPPTFFFKASPDGRYISYTLPSDPARPATGGHNYIYDTLTDKATLIPGPWDPVFNVGSEFMTLPHARSYTHYQFYSIRDVIQYGRNASPISADPKLQGLYQSVGKLFEDNQIITYRIIAENYQGHQMAEYHFYKNQRKIVKIGHTRTLCPRFKTKLPMISKDGRELGAIDVSTGLTTIFKINQDGTCEKLFDLGAKFGKVNFSFNKRFITFHKYNTNRPEITDQFVAIPDKQTTSDIYLFDREQKKLYQITQNQSHNSLYPEFLEDGSIIYINHPHDKRQKVGFVKIKTRPFLEINTLNDFFQNYPDRSTDEWTQSYILTYLINNPSIKIKKLSEFKKLYPLMEKNDLLWEFVEKLASSGHGLSENNLLVSSLKDKPQFALLLLNQKSFPDYSEVIHSITWQYFQGKLKIHEDIKSHFERFLIKEESSPLNKDLFEYFSSIYKDDDQIIIDLVLKAIDNDLGYLELDLFRKFYSSNKPTELLEILAESTFANEYNKALKVFLLSKSFMALDKEEALLLLNTALKSTKIKIDSIQLLSNLGQYLEEVEKWDLILTSAMDHGIDLTQDPASLDFILNSQTSTALNILTQVVAAAKIEVFLDHLLDSNRNFNNLQFIIKHLAKNKYRLSDHNLLSRSIELNPILASFLLNENEFEDYEKALLKISKNYVRGLLEPNPDFKASFDRFLVNSDSVPLDIPLFNFLNSEFKNDAHYIEKLILKAKNEKLNYIRLDLFNRFYRPGNLKNILEAVARPTEADSYLEALNQFLLDIKMNEFTKDEILILLNNALAAKKFKIDSTKLLDLFGSYINDLHSWQRFLDNALENDLDLTKNAVIITFLLKLDDNKALSYLNKIASDNKRTIEILNFIANTNQHYQNQWIIFQKIIDTINFNDIPEDSIVYIMKNCQKSETYLNIITKYLASNYEHYDLINWEVLEKGFRHNDQDLDRFYKLLNRKNILENLVKQQLQTLMVNPQGLSTVVIQKIIAEAIKHKRFHTILMRLLKNMTTDNPFHYKKHSIEYLLSSINLPTSHISVKELKRLRANYRKHGRIHLYKKIKKYLKENRSL